MTIPTLSSNIHTAYSSATHTLLNSNLDAQTPDSIIYLLEGTSTNSSNLKLDFSDLNQDSLERKIESTVKENYPINAIQPVGRLNKKLNVPGIQKVKQQVKTKTITSRSYPNMPPPIRIPARRKSIHQEPNIKTATSVVTSVAI